MLETQNLEKKVLFVDNIIAKTFSSNTELNSVIRIIAKQHWCNRYSRTDIIECVGKITKTVSCTSHR